MRTMPHPIMTRLRGGTDNETILRTVAELTVACGTGLPLSLVHNQSASAGEPSTLAQLRQLADPALRLRAFAGRTVWAWRDFEPHDEAEYLFQTHACGRCPRAGAGCIKFSRRY